MGELSRNSEKYAKNVLWGILGFLFAKRRSPELPLDLEKVKSVLIVRPDRLGDVVLSTPVIESVKLSIPGVRLTALVDKSNTGLLADVAEDGILCNVCKLKYPIKEDIPIMLVDEAISFD